MRDTEKGSAKITATDARSGRIVKGGAIGRILIVSTLAVATALTLILLAFVWA